jgi:hypothetical protein
MMRGFFLQRLLIGQRVGAGDSRHRWSLRLVEWAGLEAASCIRDRRLSFFSDQTAFQPQRRRRNDVVDEQVVADETGKALVLGDYDAAPVLLRPVKRESGPSK